MITDMVLLSKALYLAEMDVRLDCSGTLKDCMFVSVILKNNTCA